MTSQMLLVLLAASISFTTSFNYKDCPISGSTTFDSNGYTIIPSTTIDWGTAASNSLYPSANTWREILDAATLEMKNALTAYATAGDVAYDTVLKWAPFHVEKGGAMDWYFFYSGSCATSSSTASNSYNPGGCVASQVFEELITGISGTWLLHEYAHVYMVAMGSCEKRIAVSTAYQNAVANKSAVLTANGHTSDYYAWSNEDEYFAEMSEAYFARGGDVTDSGDWPRDINQLMNQDPIGYAAVNGMWRMTQAELDQCVALCSPQESSDSTGYGNLAWPTWAIVILSVGGGLLITAVAALAYYFLIARPKQDQLRRSTKGGGGAPKDAVLIPHGDKQESNGDCDGDDAGDGDDGSEKDGLVMESGDSQA